MKLKLLIILLLISFSSLGFSVDISSCGTLSTNNVVYNLTNNITSSSDCFIYTANNTIFEGNGFTIDNIGIADNAFRVENVFNLTIKNMTIKDFSQGTGVNLGYLASYPGGYDDSIAFNITISNVTFKNLKYGVYTLFVSNFSVTNNIFENIAWGVYLENPETSLISTNGSINNNYFNIFTGSGILFNKVENNIISNNNISNSVSGIRFIESRNNKVFGNKIYNSSSYGFIFESTAFNNSIYNNLFNNTVNFYIGDTDQNNSFNTSIENSVNIVNMPKIGGNYIGNPIKTGFSDTCADVDENGFCDSSYSISGLIDYLPLMIDATPPTINSNQTSITTPIYADTINITANVTDATTSVDYCNFTLTNPNSINVIDNVNGTQTGDIWNSTNYQINVSGNWTVNITCADTFNNSVESIWTFRADLGTITPIPSTKTYAQIAGQSETFNITLSHDGNNNNTIDFNLTGDIANATNFTITFEEDPATVEESETQYILVNITSLESMDSGTYNGNITWNRTEDGEAGVIEIEISISASIGNVVQTPETISGLSMTTEDTYNRNVYIENDGNRNLENCNVSIDTGLSTYTSFDDSNFDILIGLNTTVILTVNTPAVGVYSTTVTTTCTATSEGGLDTDTSSFLVVVTAPIPPSGGGGGGGGSVSSVCGNFVCESGESELTCPTDCIARYKITPDPLTFSTDREQRRQFEISIINLADRELDLTIKLKPVEGNDTISKYTFLVKDTIGVNELNVKIPKTIGLISGQVFITLETNLGEEVDYGTYSLNLELFDGSTIKTYPITIKVEQDWLSKVIFTFPNGTKIKLSYILLLSVIVSIALLTKNTKKQ